MKRLIMKLYILLTIIFCFSSCLLFAVEYPVISFGFNGGYGQGELNNGFLGRAFLRYSLEAYIPGFQIEMGYASSFYKSLKDEVIFNPDSVTERRNITTCSYDHYPMLTGAFHLRPFGEMTTIYFGGGAQFHFISTQRKTIDRYWDQVAEKYQETEADKTTLLNQPKFGYHVLGGFRFDLGKFGSFDLEVRQTFLNVSPDDWENKEAASLWGEKSWNNLSVNLGFTIYIF